MTRLPHRRIPIMCASAVLVALSLVGCSRETDDWRGAQAADTVAAYEQFLHQYPASSHATEATTRVTPLAEDEAWQLATSQDTQAGYQQFAARYPDGKWAQEARVRIENFALTPPSTDTPAAVMANMSGASPAPTVKAPSAAAPAPAKAAPPAAAPKAVAAAAAADKAASGYGVQLGAYSTKAGADSAWTAASKRFKAELGSAGHEVVAGKSGSATLYRLRVAQPSESAARGLCDKLKVHSQACVVFHP